MLRTLKTLVSLTPILVVLSVSAQLEETPDPSGPSEIEMVQVETGTGRPADCIAPLAVHTVDDEMVVVPAQGFLIEPGWHKINGRATLDTSRCPLVDSRLQFGSVPDLEVEFVTGFTYHIGFDYSPADSARWQLVVWKMEQNEPAVEPGGIIENQPQ